MPIIKRAEVKIVINDMVLQFKASNYPVTRL